MENNDQSPEYNESNNENLVEDLKKALENTIDETKNILEDLERTVEKTINDESTSVETKKIVDIISAEIADYTISKSKNTLKTNNHLKGFNNLEEE